MAESWGTVSSKELPETGNLEFCMNILNASMLSNDYSNCFQKGFGLTLGSLFVVPPGRG